MTDLTEPTDEDMMETAETWISLEIGRVQRKLGLTPHQMLRVLVAVSSKKFKHYLEIISREDEEKS